MATCSELTVVPDCQAFQPSKTAVKAVADSTELRPRRSRVNYNCVKTLLQCNTPKKRGCARKEVGLSRSKAGDNDDTEPNIPVNRQKNVSLIETFPGKTTQKRKLPKAAGPKLKKQKVRLDSTSGKEEGVSVEIREKFTSSSADRQSNGCKDRLLMRQWLELEADRGNIPGLRWFDQNERLIRITWRHGSRTEWSTSDVTVFKCWAQHTGRYNAKDNDYKRWKANFRCALNSLHDVKEVAEKRSTKIHDPYKVYRLLPAIPAKKRRRESVKSSISSSAESASTAMTEEAIQTDGIFGDLTDNFDVLTPEELLPLMPLSNSSGCEQIFLWSSLDPVYNCDPVVDAEILETADAPLTYLDHCYADMENMNQLKFQSLPPCPPSPYTPFNDAIPVPVQDLIESSEEFQMMITADESQPVSEQQLISFCDVNVGGQMNDIQAGTVSSTNDKQLLESILQGICASHFQKQIYLNVPAAVAVSSENASLDQHSPEQKISNLRPLLVQFDGRTKSCGVPE